MIISTSREISYFLVALSCVLADLMVYVDLCYIGYGPSVIINQWVILRNGQFISVTYFCMGELSSLYCIRVSCLVFIVHSLLRVLFQ